MPWDRSQPTDPKYRSKRHRNERTKWERVMRTQGYLTCAQPVCLQPTRLIQQGEAWHTGHDDAGVEYIGPVHADCNRKDGARRARARQSAPRRWFL